MKCPVCVTESLLMSDRQGVEIDYCPKCRGVWLDRGELDKIIERTAVEAAPVPKYANEPKYSNEPAYRPQEHYGHNSNYSHHKKKKSILGELFDF